MIADNSHAAEASPGSAAYAARYAWAAATPRTNITKATCSFRLSRQNRSVRIGGEDNLPKGGRLPAIDPRFDPALPNVSHCSETTLILAHGRHQPRLVSVSPPSNANAASQATERARGLSFVAGNPPSRGQSPSAAAATCPVRVRHRICRPAIS